MSGSEKEVSLGDKNIAKSINSVLGSKSYNKTVASILNHNKNKESFSIGVGNFFKVARVAFVNPVNAFRLFKFYRNGARYDQQAIVRKVLEGNQIWQFIESVNDNMESASILAKHFGGDVFREDGPLNKDSLMILKGALNDKEVIGTLKSVAIESVREYPDQSKILNDLIKMTSQSSELKNYFKSNKDKIKDYVVSQIDKTVSQEKTNQEKWEKLVDSDKKTKTDFLKNNTIALTDKECNKIIANGLPETTEKNLENYGLTVDELKKLMDVVPLLLDRPDELLQILEHQKHGQYPEIGRILLEVAKDEPAIKGYFEQNKDIFKKIMHHNLREGGYDVSDKMSDFLAYMVTEKNLPNTLKLTNLVQKKSYTEAAIEFLKMIEQDPDFAGYVQEHQEDIAKMIKSALNQVPDQLPNVVRTIEPQDLAVRLISDTKNTRELLEAFNKGEAGGMLKGAGKNIPLLAKGLKTIAVQQVTGVITADRQEIINKMLDSISDKTRDNQKEHKFHDIIKKYFKENFDNPPENGEYDKSIKQRTFFNDAIIRLDKTSSDSILNDRMLKLENLHFNGDQFVGSKINQVSFDGSKFTNTSFYNSELKNVKFSNTTIDGGTLYSLLDHIRTGSISLEGAKIEGDVSYAQNMSNLDLSGADLSGVTSMEGVNVAGIKLQNTKLPKNLNVFVKTYGLSEDTFPDSVSDSKKKEILKKNQGYITKEIYEKMIYKAKANGVDLTDDQKESLKNTINDLYNDKTIIGKNFRKSINNNPEDLIAVDFPKLPEAYNNVKDYENRTSNILTTIYNNIKSPSEIKQSLLADVIGLKVTKKLFGEGGRRGKDGIQIRDGIAKAVKLFSQKGEDINSDYVLQGLENEDMTKKLSDIIYEKTKYTSAGLATGGMSDRIYLPEDLDKDAVGKIRDEMNKKLSSYKLTDKEMKLIKEISNEIGKNLFDDGVEDNRKDDANLIMQQFIDCFTEIKGDLKQKNIDRYIKDKKSILTNNGAESGITQFYRDNSESTFVGRWMGTGGIHFKDSEVLTEKFKKDLKQRLNTEIKSSIDDLKEEEGHKKHKSKTQQRLK